MGKYYHAALLLFLLPLISFSQRNSATSADSLVNEFTEELKAQGFEKIGYTKHYCPGYYRIWKPGERCDYSTEYYQVYVFWEDSLVSFVKKFDNCGAYTSVQMSNSPFFDFFEDNTDGIMGEMVTPFEYTKYVNGKPEQDKVRTNHSCRREFKINWAGEYISKNFDLFDLKKKDGDRDNDHYSANNKLKLVQWDERISKLVWKIEDRGGFIREFVQEEISESASE